MILRLVEYRRGAARRDGYGVRVLLSLLLCASMAVRAAESPNVIFVLADDHRYDELGFLNDALSTPNLDRLAREGVHFRNAFVTTSLCSPSRASILTGLYAHSHGVVDNREQTLKPSTVYFPRYLQEAGYQTAFIGKWHMGRHTDEPQPGFDHWVSFAGQGVYVPDGDSLLNVNGRRVSQQGYITDELTDYALNWLNGVDPERPFFLYLSHKAVHSDFTPAHRHADLYSGQHIPMPASSADTEENNRGKPMWVKNQRNSFHGIDFPYHGSLDIQEHRRNYRRTLSAVDESVGRLLDWLRRTQADGNTVILYMGDNGFMFGEHGLIDKRNAYEESIRVPLLARAPGRFPAGARVAQMVANIDVAPTILELAGARAGHVMHGRSFVALAEGRAPDDWRTELLYEYFWEWIFPQTPTTFAIRTDRYKLIQYHGIWDTDELYDLEADPREMENLVNRPEHRTRVRAMRQRLYELIVETGGTPEIPYTIKRGHGLRFRDPAGAEQGRFPDSIYREPDPPDRYDYED
jgi:arylsulfatase A-like enzyme